jgi:hypothetical protein
VLAKFEMRSGAACSLLAALLLVAAVSNAAASPSGTTDAAVDVAESGSAAARKLLRGEAVAPYLIRWTARRGGLGTVRLRAGTIVQFNVAKGSGLGYGLRQCTYSRKYAQAAPKAVTFRAKIPRGGYYWGDPTGRNCANGLWVYIVGF